MTDSPLSEETASDSLRPSSPAEQGQGSAETCSGGVSTSASSSAWTAGEMLILTVILILALFLRAWNISKEGSGNAYYYAAVRSMLASPSNFFFGSFDPVGIVTVDKPPMALWVQGLSARLFGFNTRAVMLPQALLGVLNVFLTWKLMRTAFSSRAALLAGLIMAVMPIAVALDRVNMPDTLLLTTVLLSALALLRSCHTGSPAALTESLFFLGIGFTTKMLAAWVVLPAWFAVWWKSTPVQGSKKIGQTVLAGATLIASSLAWALIFDLTPPEKRPYGGGSNNNSMLELTLGYNGLGRIFGGMGNMPGGGARGPMRKDSAKAKDFQPEDAQGKDRDMTKAGGPPDGPPFGGPPGMRGLGGRGGPGGMFFSAGPIGPWRMIWPTMAGLAFWLTPFALRAFPGLRLVRSQCFDVTQATQALLAGWFVMWGLVLCMSNGIMHPYYSIMIGPAMAGLAAITLDELLEKGWPKGRWGVAFFVAALAWQLVSVGYSPEWRLYLGPAIALVVGSSYFLVNFKAEKFQNSPLRQISILGFLVAPALWALTPTFGKYPGMMPAADPSFIYNKSAQIMGPPGGNVSFENRQRLYIYLKKHKPGSKILMAMGGAPEVAPFIIETGDKFVSLGGFQGRDPVFTEEGLLEMVKKGELVYVMSMPRGGPGRGGPGGPPNGGPAGGFPGGPLGGSGGPPGNNVLNQVIEKYGELVDAKEWFIEDRQPADVPEYAPPFMRDMMRRPPALYRLHSTPREKKPDNQPPAAEKKV